MGYAKVSPVLWELLERSSRNTVREVLVIYRVKNAPKGGMRAGFTSTEERAGFAQERARIQARTQSMLLDKYRQSQESRPRREHTADRGTVGGSSLPIISVGVTKASLKSLADEPDVVAILPNQPIHLIGPEGVTCGPLSAGETKNHCTWALDALGVPDFWETAQVRGEGVAVGVLDTGVFADHPALSGRVRDFVLIDPLGRRVKAEPNFDAACHGTHVCGTIAGQPTADGVAIGVAPRAQLLVAGVLLGEPTLATLFEGISWAVDHGVDIVNMSLGFSYYEPQFGDLLDLLLDDFGVLPVVAIGNDSHGNTSCPGNVKSAFSVGALQKRKGGGLEVAPFSGGASLALPAEAAVEVITKPDVVAPGVDIWSCIPPQESDGETYTYGYMQGTSMATPHVAGIAALLMAARPAASVRAILQALRETAWHPAGHLRPDNRWGYGIVRVGDALKELDTHASQNARRGR